MQGATVSAIRWPPRCESCRSLLFVILTSIKSQFASPPTLVIHGLEATGKSLTINDVLESLDIPSVITSSRQCITARHLLERTLAAVIDVLGDEDKVKIGTAFDGRCDSISAFTVKLQRLLEGRGKFILAFDGIDHQREAYPTLLPAIARLGEIVRLIIDSLSTSLKLLDTIPDRYPHCHVTSSRLPSTKRGTPHPLPYVYSSSEYFHYVEIPSSNTRDLQ